MTDRFDFVIYGLTGFTGVYCLKNLVKINSEKNKNYSFAVAGRNEAKLRQVLKDVGEELKQDLSNTKVIIANADDKESLVQMTKQAKVVCTVVGPYYLYGRPLVQACLETSTHYVDISGEPQFIEKIQCDYHKEAKEKGLFIVSSCGFDSIPADLGSMYLKDQSADDEIKTVEGYIKIKNPKGFTINTGTFFSLLESLRNYKKLRPIRDELFNKFYAKKMDSPKMSLRPIQRSPFGGQSGYFIPFWQIDKDVVKRTQLFYYNEDQSYKPLALREYLYVPSLVHILGMLLVVASIGLFNLCDFTRNLLKKYPKYLTFGLFSTGGPSKEQVDTSSFEFFLVGKGHKKDDPSKSVSKTLYIKGPELAYDATSLLLLNAGITILEELADKRSEKSGVVTPGYAFRETNYVEKIRELGMEWKVIDQ